MQSNIALLKFNRKSLCDILLYEQGFLFGKKMPCYIELIKNNHHMEAETYCQIAYSIVEDATILKFPLETFSKKLKENKNE